MWISAFSCALNAYLCSVLQKILLYSLSTEQEALLVLCLLYKQYHHIFMKTLKLRKRGKKSPLRSVKTVYEDWRRWKKLFSWSLWLVNSKTLSTKSFKQVFISIFCQFISWTREIWGWEFHCIVESCSRLCEQVVCWSNFGWTYSRPKQNQGLHYKYCFIRSD